MAVDQWYNFHSVGCHLGNVGLDDPEMREYFVPVEWIQTVPREGAFRERGLFGNRHTVCRPTAPKWRDTIDLLKQRFPEFDK